MTLSKEAKQEIIGKHGAAAHSHGSSQGARSVTPAVAASQSGPGKGIDQHASAASTGSRAGAL